MLRRQLAIQEVDSGAKTDCYQAANGDLGPARHPAEHRFTKKTPAETNPVYPAGQPSFIPAFHRVGVTAPVHADISFTHSGSDPGSMLSAARCTPVYDLIESLIK